jgi:hypothetical protein
MNVLANTLLYVAKPSHQYVTPDGSRLLLLPYGARVLGLYAAGSDENFFWTHPDLNDLGSAGSYFESSDWHNTGGDRTWLAPEVDVFFPNYPATDVYRIPAEVDPGNYSAVKPGGMLRLVAPFSITLWRGTTQVRGRITKSWNPAPNPLRFDAIWKALSGVAYAGYTQQTSLELLPGQSPIQLGLWSLLAVPQGGELLVPTYHRVAPEIYSGPIATDELVATSHLIRFSMRGTGIQKIGIPAVASTGRIGALYPNGGDWALVVRNFVVDPSGAYVDVPWNNPSARGEFVYSTQACRVNNHFGTYCELEYHTAAIGMDATRLRSDDTSQVWAFRGSLDAMRKIAKLLISEDMN